MGFIILKLDYKNIKVVKAFIIHLIIFTVVNLGFLIVMITVNIN
jgi:hypothetical protein